MSSPPTASPIRSSTPPMRRITSPLVNRMTRNPALGTLANGVLLGVYSWMDRHFDHQPAAGQ
jgi:hypothetical protein